ncbi:hypothetical protein Bca101_061900 [Brassica carinata]
MDITYITDGTAREATFNLRKDELMKKLHELHVLCDVDTCAVIYKQCNPNPEVWPSHSEVKSILEKFEMFSEKQKTRRSVNHEEFLHQMIERVRTKIQKQNDLNKEKYMRELMFACLSGNMGDLSLNDDDRSELCSVIDQYVKELVHHNNRTLNDPNFEIGQSSSMAVDLKMAPTPIAEPTKMLQSVISEYHSDVAHDNAVVSIPSASSNQEVYIPVMNQDESYKNQNLEQGFVEEMMKIGEQTGFPWMEDNHRF